MDLNYINRITVEFKFRFIGDKENANTILIESQWNLNNVYASGRVNKSIY